MKDKDKKELIEKVEKGLDSQMKAVQTLLAGCFIVGQLIPAMTAITATNLPKNEKYRLMIKSINTICPQVSKAFPDAAEFIEKARKDYLKNIKELREDKGKE